MRNPLVILVLCFCSLTNAVPLGLKKNMAIVQEQEDPMLMMAEDEETRPEMMISRLNLPSNATSIRADITDGFSCDNKTYGYYADVENECQIFHVCLPVTYADGKENTFRWSFICPEETVFSQEYFTCMRSEDMSINCEESFKYYELNRNFGMIEPEETPADEADEDMNMEEMSRQPSTIQGEEEPNKQSIETAPIKKQTNKVQNSNRRKTQANRVSIEAQRKKVQPVRRLPKPAVVATTAKPIVEESPILEQEVERTTLKYQRLTKRPIAVIPEQPKPEEPKPEKEVLRQELFAQKRKRPQIYFPSRFDAAQQIDSEANPLPFLKTDILMPKQPEIVVQNQAEPQVQASEIAEVSIKPQVEKIDSLPVLEKEPVPVKEEEIKPIVELKFEIAPLPENIPSRVEVVEIPIQKVDEPLVAEGEAVLAQAPAPEEAKPIASVIEPIKGEEVEIPAEDILLKKIVAQIEKVAEPMKPAEEEKMPIDQVLEPELITLDEPEQSLEALKTVELPKPLEPVKTEETIMESKIPESEVIPQVKLEEPVAEEKPEVLAKVETPVEEEKLEAEVLPKVELPAEKPAFVEVPAPEKPEESQMALKINVAAPEVPEPEAEKPSEDSKPQAPEPVVLETQPEKTLIVENVETPVLEPEVVLKSEVPEVKPEEPLKVEASVPAIEKNLNEKMPSVEEVPAPESNMQMDLEAPTLESMEKLEKQSEIEAPLANEKIVKIMETIPDAKIELPVETVSKPLESLIEPVKEEISASELLSAEVQAEKASELSADEQMRETEANAEKEIVQSANDNEEAQSLILDFISSLVNSENSNFEDQSVIGNEMSSDSLPEASIPEQVVAEAEPVKIQTEDSQINPLYIPVMPNNDQMYQIPVQVIETPEPEPIVPVPVVPEPKLPLTVDDVVELVKESLDHPTVEKENIVQEQPSNDDDGSSQPESEEVKPIYHRYIELGSNLLKSEALTASDDEPVITPTENEKTLAEKEEVSPELPKAIVEEKLPETEQLAAKSDSLPEVPAIQTEQVATEVKLDSQLPIESLKEGRSLNRFRMDPRKRRFLFRSDAR